MHSGQTCYQPKPPTLLDANDIEAVLDYFVSYEFYKEGINDFIDTCLDVGTTYADKWDEYYENVSAFKIPPFATYTAGVGILLLTNVPVGKTYLVYSIKCTDYRLFYQLCLYYRHLLPRLAEDVVIPETVQAELILHDVYFFFPIFT